LKEEAMAKSTYPTTGDSSPVARAQRETYWRRQIERCKASGLGKSEFCRREKISPAALHWWTGEIRRRYGRSESIGAQKMPTRQTRASAFVPVRVKQLIPPSQKPVEVVVAGYVVRVIPDFDPETLRRLVALLEGEDEQC
jgi:hypothetical protein